MDIKKIKQPVEVELKTFESYFKSRVKTVVPLLDTIINYIIRNKGKQVRPMMVFLSANVIAKPGQKTYEAAALIELLHTATLIHDDIVDEAYERRHSFSVNALWKSKKAVLIGDYLLSKGLLTALEHKNYDLLHSISDAVAQMSEGELMQAKASRSNHTDIELYLEIIRRKTATLFAACTLCGAQSVNAEENQLQALKIYGESAGMLFQIKDDLLDFEESNQSGKTTGNDLANMKFTLPLLLAMQSKGIETKQAFKNYIRKNYKSFSIETVRKFINESDAKSKVEETIQSYRMKGLAALKQLPDNDANKSLVLLLDYIVERNK